MSHAPVQHNRPPRRVGADGVGGSSAQDPLARINVDASGNATTNNTTYYVDTNIQISWKATFTSTNGVASGNPAPCERSDIANLDDDITSP